MAVDLNRREILAALAALGVFFPGRVLAQGPVQPLRFGEPQPFSFDGLVERARVMAAAPYVPDVPRAADILDRVDYVEHMQIGNFTEDELPVGINALIQPLHLGKYFPLPVTLNAVEDGEAREVLYSEGYFWMPDDNPARELPDDLGFGGFRVLVSSSRRDWLAFLGAAYFRSGGELRQYGQSARAVAIDVAMPTPEEFPRFTDFWFEAKEGNGVVVHCLMNGPRITGALRMECAYEGAVVMDIDARYFTREAIERVGIAPLTSMFWYSETNARTGTDWRPEIHDTDGLAIWNGTGERIWRPINNPPRIMTSTFADPGVRGFGLLQRDRDFSSYQDSYIAYERRPSAWIEPVGDWGPGSVQLVEIPTDDEIHDNIVAYWLPEAPVEAGAALAFAYRLHWVGEEPYPPTTARVVATRLGKGGDAGTPPPKGVTKVVIDLQGGPLARLDETYLMNTPTSVIVPNVTVSQGIALGAHAFAVAGTDLWRAVFDYSPATLDPVEMRMFLVRDGEPLSETWSFQFHPTELPDPPSEGTTAAP